MREGFQIWIKYNVVYKQAVSTNMYTLIHSFLICSFARYIPYVLSQACIWLHLQFYIGTLLYESNNVSELILKYCTKFPKQTAVKVFQEKRAITHFNMWSGIAVIFSTEIVKWHHDMCNEYNMHTFKTLRNVIKWSLHGCSSTRQKITPLYTNASFCSPYSNILETTMSLDSVAG